MSFAISKDFTFSAAHHLIGLPPTHQCSRLHGHNYTVRVIIATDNLDDTGFVVDYGELNWFRRLIDTEYDHRHLNTIIPFNTTAENLAHHFHAKVTKWLSTEYAVREFDLSVGVSETDKTWAWYEDTIESAIREAAGE